MDKLTRKYIFRIKDLKTGLYYSSRNYIRTSNKNELIDDSHYLKKNSLYSYKQDVSWGTYHYFLYFDEIGHFYPTRGGAEKMISEFTESKRMDRQTKAAILLNSRFPFIVVKSEIKCEDIDETENVSISAKNKPKISK